MEPWLIAIADYLLAQSWQIAVLTIVVALATFGLHNRSAHVRYLLWLIVLAKALVPPLYSIPVAVLPQQEQPAYVPAPPTADKIVAESESRGEGVPPLRLEGILPSTRSASSPDVLLNPARYSTRAWLSMTWFAGFVALSCYYLLNALRTQIWLQKRRKALPSESGGSIESFFTTHGVRRMPRIWLLERINQPFVWGLVRGSIYLPADLLDGRHAKFQPSLLGHELSHVVRLDAMVNSLQVIAQMVFWFHPCLWWANRKIRAEREKCCDEMTIARLNAPPEEYSEAIVETLASKYEQARPVPSLAVAGQVKNIEERIRTMLRPGKEFYKHPSLPVAAVVVLLSLLAVPTTVVLTARAASMPPADSAGADLIFENPTNLGPSVNSPDEDYGPSLSADELELYFNSLRPGGLGQSDLWVATRKTKADPWGKAVNLGPTVNGPAGDISPRISADGLSLSFGSDRPGGYGAHDLWVTTRKDKSAPWGEPVNLGPTVTSPADELSPSLSANGLELYFSGHASFPEATRPGGSGESDLWVTTRKTATDPWGAPVNLGPTVNSPVADASPSISADGLSLYFTSDRPGGSGGNSVRAIWVTWRKSTSDPWGKPVKLGLAVNTGFEANPEVSRDGSTLYFFSRRPGGSGGADLWQATLAKSTPESRQAAQLATSLHEAVKGRDIEQVGALLAKGANANAKDGGGRTPLHLAVLYGNLDIVRFLVDHGAKLDAKDQDGWTAFRYAATQGKRDLVEFLASKDVGLPSLHVAVSVGDLARVKALVEQGANVDAADELGWTPLYWATCLRRIEIAKLLIARAASVQVVAKDGGTLLLRAVQAGDRELVDLLLSKGADTKAKDKWGWTPLHCAAATGRQEIAELLIAKEADVNAKTSGGQTPLDVAVGNDHRALAEMLAAKGADVSTVLVATQIGDVTKVKTLLERGADVNAQDGSGRTALHYAAQGGFQEIVQVLLAKGATVNIGAFGSENKTAADFAMENNHSEIVELLFSKGADISALHVALQRKDRAKAKDLIENGADVKKRSPWGMTALHLAARAGFADVAELLIAKGADVNAKLNWTWTPLHHAAAEGHRDVVELLVAKGADVNIKDPWGETPLDYAVAKGDRAVVVILAAQSPPVATLHAAAVMGDLAKVKALLEQGADGKAVKGPYGRTAAEYALEGNHPEIVELLIAKGVADVSPLHLAVQKRDLAQVRDLLGKGADVNKRTQYGTAPLHLAARAGLTEIAALLVDKGANVNVTDKWSWTPLHDAAEAGHADVAELLIAKGAEVNARDPDGRTPLSYAQEKAHSSVVDLLQKHGAKE